MRTTTLTKKLNLFEVLGKVVKLTPRIPTLLKNSKAIKALDKNSQQSIGQFFESHAIQHKEVIALRFEDQSYTYAAFNEEVNRYANYLLQKGVQPEETVMVMLENRPALLFLIGACIKIGAVASLINPNQRGNVLLHSITLDPSNYYFIGEELVAHFEAIKPALANSKQAQYYWVPDLQKEHCPDNYQDVNQALKDVSDSNPPTTNQVKLGQRYANVFTSGTTGMPKASRQLHHKWLATYHWFGKIHLNLQPSDVFYVPLPFYHTNALLLSWSSVIAGACTMVIRRKFSVREFWKDVDKYGVTAFVYIGELCRYLLNAPPSKLDNSHQIKKIIGNGLRPDIWKTFKQRFNIETVVELYGASESIVAFTNTLNIDETIGWSPQNFKIIKYDVDNDCPVKDKNGYCIPVKKGGTGLLISEITEKEVFDGYVNKAKNEAKILRDVFEKGDAWFNSGDLLQDIGYKHARFVDRIGDTFRWKGENCATTEVEAIVNTLEGVDLCTVYGVQIPNNDGRAGMLTIVPKPNASVDMNQLAAQLQQELPQYAVPLFVRISKGMETTHTHKIKKNKLKAEAFNVTDPVYVLLPKTDRYQEMTATIRAAVNEGKYVF